MYESKNPLSAISYTNKDFQSIYEELLETAKMLARNWDPTISNESDPGVVLLKLNAIIGDKNNYNIDKNILENYPETYTQEFSARSQYRQLGYKMPWYRAAKTDITFKWVGKKLSDGDSLTIDKYTMVTDSDDSVVYTILRDVNLGKASGVDVKATVPAIQGIINTLKITGSEIITLSNLDSRNRLYIRDRYIAENGIFVTGRSTSNAGEWLQVDNVEVYPSNIKCYEFDIDPLNGYPYLQFPDDIRDLIGDGLTVKYVVTNGLSGNVAAKVINKFYNSTVTSLNGINGSEKVTLNEDNIQLFNITGTTDGSDPETIEDAYKSFKRTVATFDTLVTLRDYLNAVYTSEYVSNAVVTDRTNDIQSTYRIIDKNNSSILGYIDYQTEDDSRVAYTKVDLEYIRNHPDKNVYVYNSSEGVFSRYDGEYSSGVSYYVLDAHNKHLNAFDLKFYLLKNGGLLNSLSEYNSTFEVENSNSVYQKLGAYLDGKKSIQHDRKDIQPNIPFMLQNLFPIKLKIVPAYKLSGEQQEEVKSNILMTLMRAMNSRRCEFGEEPNYDLIYNEIASCDERIKVVIMDDFVYTTYAVYLDKPTSSSTPEFKYVPISDYANCDSIIIRDKGSVQSVTSGMDDLSIKNRIKQNLVSAVSSIKGTGKISLDELKSYLFVDSTYGIAYKVRKDLASVDSLRAADLVVYSDKLLDIRKEIIARNVLAGVTPLFDVDDSFNLSLNMKVNNEMSQNTDTISTGLTVAPFGLNARYDPSVRSANYTLKDNESIRLYAPSFISDATYSNYVKFELVLARPTLDKTKYNSVSAKDENELRATYGDDGFYKLSRSYASPEYEPVVTKQYEALKREAPRFKYGHYYVRSYDGSDDFELATGHGGLVEVDKSSLITELRNTAYAPEFEANMFYRKSVDMGSVVFECLTKIPSDWSSNYTNYFIRKSNCVDYLPMVDMFTVDDFEDGASAPVKNATATYRKIAVTFTEVPTPDSITEPLYIKNVEVVGEGDSATERVWYTIVTDESELIGQTVYTRDWSYTSQPMLGSKITDWNDNWESYAIEVNLSEIPIQDERCFIRLNKYLTEVCGETSYGGYDILMLSDETPDISEFEGKYKSYHKCSQPVAWETEYYEYYVRSLTSAGLSMHSVGSVIPNFSDNIYRQTVNGDSSITYDIVGNRPETWEDTFQLYYKLVSSNYVGLHPNSPETAEWRAGRLSLYTPAVTYNIPANTEYQLQEGDYITFYYRETNEDDAPYTYIRYNHMYDESTDQPTIIKANFTIHASSYSNCLIHPQYLNSSGYIPYDGGDNSKFQVIFTKMYDEYDLSGTKKIEMRAINHVKLDNTDKKYYYVITSNKNTVDDVEYFSMKLKRTKSSSGKVRYTHTLQNDEYFLYVNKDKTLFEVLSSGTLIEYFPGTPQGIRDNGDDTVTLTNPSIDVSKIMYSGIDAFSDQCSTVYSDDRFKLVEQQIYALTSGDSVHIQLDESFDYNCTQVNSDDIFDSDKVYFSREGKYIEVVAYKDATGYMSFPPFVANMYYVYDTTEGIYKVLNEKPSSWGVSSDVTYYTSTGDEYTVIDNMDEDEFNRLKAGGNLYWSDTPTYPEFSSDEISPVKNYSVSYRSGGSAYTALPNISVNDGDYGWNAMASLNLRVDSGSYQKIEPDDAHSRRTVKIGDASYPSNGETKPLYIMSDIPLDKLGGDDIDISYVNLLGDRLGANLLVYQELLGEDDGDWTALGDGRVGLTIRKECRVGQVFTLDGICLDEDFQYILPVESYSDTLNFRFEVQTAVSGGSTMYQLVPCICHRHQGAIGNDKHYFKLPVNTTGLRITVAHSPANDSVILFNTLFKYRERDLFTDTSNNGTGLRYGVSTQDILDKIYEMDAPRVFDYTHIPEKDVKIDDPLIPQSLFDVNHVYNKFSIAKAVLNESRLGGFSTIFVNNR